MGNLLNNAVNWYNATEEIGSGSGGSVSAWGDLTGTLSDQTDLKSALDAKADATHVHAIDDVTGLQAVLSGKADDNHSHVMADVTDLVEGAEFFVIVIDEATAVTTGDGKRKIPIPATMNAHNITEVHASVPTVSSSGTVTVAIRRDRGGSVVDVLSTDITIDANEKSSRTAAAPPVINASNDDLATDDWLYFDVDGAGTGTTGLIVYVKTQKP